MMKKIGKDKKGFTLVELIVVLVILAILAAILVPALLGWVDRARQGQDIVNGKALMTAIQAEMTKEYGNNSGAFSNFDNNNQDYDDIFMSGDSEYEGFLDKVLELTGIEKPFVLLFYTKKIGAAEIADGGPEVVHDAYKVLSVVYWRTADSKPVYYNFVDNVWEEGSPYSADIIQRGGKKPKVNEIKKGDLAESCVRVCIVGGTSKNCNYKKGDKKNDKIVNINNMILKAVNYKKGGINWKEQIDSVKIE